MVRIGAFPALGPGSIPGIGIYLYKVINVLYTLIALFGRADDRVVKVLVSRAILLLRYSAAECYPMEQSAWVQIPLRPCTLLGCHWHPNQVH